MLKMKDAINLKIIDLIQKENPDLLLRINTNLSILTPKLYNQLKTLKNVHWIVSAESTGAKFNYIRWPGKYQTLINGIIKLGNESSLILIIEWPSNQQMNL